MPKKILIVFTLLSIWLLGNNSRNYAAASAKAQVKESQPARHSLEEGGTGTLQKMIVESGSITMDLDLNGLNGTSSLVTRPVTLHFAVAANSFFPILVFSDLLRGPEPGSIGLVLQDASALPEVLSESLKQLVIEKLASDQAFDLAVRDGNTGLIFFDIEGHHYDYDANAKSLTITGGRLLISKEFANAIGRPSDAGAVIGRISIGAAMRSIELTQLVNGEPKSVVMPPLGGTTRAGVPTQTSGPDVIVGDLPAVQQLGSAGTQVGLAVATTSCNNGDQPVDWFQLPNTDHPVVPQNLYRMSGGTDNTERFEQIGQSWLKHTFFALEDDACGFGCNTSGCATGSHLCPGCSDPYSANLNGDQTQIGSRAWVNPFTGNFPTNANDHSGHNHNGVAHRVLVEVDDLNTTLNQGATYFAEAQYVAPSEYTWCQAHPTECNMYNNASYRQYSVSGTINFTFSPIGNTVRMQPAIRAWTGATVNRLEPDSGNDGFWFMGYKVTNPSAGVWHYEYALYNMNLDRAIQSFSVPLAPGINVSNIGFHAPPQHPGFAHDGTAGDAGYSSTPWAPTQTANSLTWNCESFAQNQNANAIRWGTLYNFRFDADQPPQASSATIGFFKTGSPVTVAIQGPVGGTPTPTPTSSPTPTSTATPTATPRPTPTPRTSPIPRSRPTPPPRPTPPH
jgi:hypothetical protein